MIKNTYPAFAWHDFKFHVHEVLSTLHWYLDEDLDVFHHNNCNPEITCFFIIYRCWLQRTSYRYRLLPISNVNKLVKVNASRFSILLWENTIIARWSSKSSLFEYLSSTFISKKDATRIWHVNWGKLLTLSHFILHIYF